MRRQPKEKPPRRTPDVRRRALKIIAAHPGGCTEAILAAQRSELLDDVGAVVATTLWITAAGEWVLAAQM